MKLEIKVESKTSDDVFVDLLIAVQFLVSEDEDTVMAALYKLSNPGQQIASYVFDTVRALVPEMGVGALAAFLARCDLLVSGDSGPLHMAVALGIPVVGLYGPSDPVRNGPYGGRFRVVRGVVPCGPCYRRRCARRDCMEAIGVEAVWEALVSLKEEIAAATARAEEIPDLLEAAFERWEELESL